MSIGIHIDVETFCKLPLVTRGREKGVGVYRYTEHESFEILCIKWRTSDGQKGGVAFWGDYIDDLLAFCDAVERADYAVAFNANFERRVFLSLWSRKMIGCPKLQQITFWRCAMVQAMANGLPGDLDRCAKAFLGVGKDEDGRRAMLKLCKPRKASKKDPSTRWTYQRVPSDYQAMYDYCGVDVDREYDIWNGTRPLTEYEWRLYWLDQEINDRGVKADLNHVIQSIGRAQQAKYRMNDTAIAEYGINLTNTAQIARICRLPKADKDTLTNALADDTGQFTPYQRTLMELRLQYAKTSVGKYQAMERSMAMDGRLHGMFQMYGAGPGRWAGRIVQLQNLPSKGVPDVEGAMRSIVHDDIELSEAMYGPTMDLLSRLIRPTLMAEEGHKLVVCDYRSIEAVVLGWASGCRFYLDRFESDRLVYEAMAAKTYGINIEDVNSTQRHLGKTAILGLGYQMGVDKFIDTARKQGSEESEWMLRQAHAAYRSAAWEITDYEVGMWAQMNEAALKAMTNEGKVIHALKDKVRFLYQGRWLHMRLPSGRPVSYFEPRREYDDKFKRWGVSYMEIDSTTKQWRRARTYGGKLTENYCQGTSADLLMNAMFTCEGLGWPVVAHVHDELICEVPEEMAEAKTLEGMMCELPGWAKGMPVAAQGKVVARYEK